MALTDKLSVLATYCYNQLVTQKTALGIAEVYYGDQERIPFTPTVVVETGTKEKILKGVPRRYSVTMSVFLLVYHNAVQSPQTNQSEADDLAAAIETYFDTLGTCGGIVIHSAVASVEMGYVRRDTTLRTTRIRFDALSQSVLPLEP